MWGHKGVHSHRGHQINPQVGPQEGTLTQGSPDKPTCGPTRGCHTHRGHQINPHVGPHNWVSTHRGHQINPHVGPKGGVTHRGHLINPHVGPQGSVTHRGHLINHMWAHKGVSHTQGPPMRDNVKSHPYVRAGTNKRPTVHRGNQVEGNARDTTCYQDTHRGFQEGVTDTDTNGDRYQGPRGSTVIYRS